MNDQKQVSQANPSLPGGIAPEVGFTALSNAMAGSPAQPARTVQASVRGRWWKPSFADGFVLALVIWTFISGPHGWVSLLADGDAGWHIRTGETILDTGAVPYTDPYSFSKPGQPWFAWEWLSDVGLAALHRAGGLKAVVWFSGVLIAAFAGVLLRYMLWKGANAFVAMITTLVAVGACSIHFLARPHLTTLLLIPVLAWMIEADRRQPSNRIWLWVPLFALWTNLHGGFVAGIILLGAAAVGTAVECLAARKSLAPAYRYGILTAACAAATIVNPYGIELHKHVAAYLQSDWIRQVVHEFQAPSFRGESAMEFEGLLLLGVIAAAYLLREGRVVETLWIVGLAHMALGSQRHITLYASVASPFVASLITSWWERLCAGRPKNSVGGILGQLSRDLTPVFGWNSVWLGAALVVILALDGAAMHWPSDFAPAMFPTGVLQKYKDRMAESRTLTTDQWGDYLIYHNPVRQKVFVDGRSDFYGREVGGDYLQLMNGGHQWEQIMQRWGFNLVVAPPEWPLTSLLKRSADWKLLEDNGKVLVFRLESGSRQGPKF